MSDDDLLAWADACLAAVGRSRTGDAAVRADQPWGRVLRLPTAEGPVWLKQPTPAMRFEFGVLRLLGGVDPVLTPSVLASDAERGVVLLADAGTPFSDAYDDAERPARFAAALVEVGRLQRASMPLVPELLAAGVPDLRTTSTLTRFDELVDALGCAGTGRTLSARGSLRLMVQVVARSAVPASIEHNDLHDGNVLVDPDGRVTVIDWGDAVVTHPFAVLLIAQRVLSSLAGGAPVDHPVIAAARRDYLAVFADLAAPGEDLELTARFAVLVAHFGRAWAWQRALEAFEASGRDAGDYAGAALEWLNRGADAWHAAIFEDAETFPAP